MLLLVIGNQEGIHGNAGTPYITGTPASHCWRGIWDDVLTFLRSDSDEVQRLIRDLEVLQFVG